VAPGYILTNSHVVGDASRDMTVYIMSSTLPPAEATVVAHVNERGRADYALLRYQNRGSGQVPVLSFSLDPGDLFRVEAMGYPSVATLESSASMRMGFRVRGGIKIPEVINAEGIIVRVLRGDGDAGLIFHSAPTGRGFSGGPLVNNTGEVLGICTAGTGEATGPNIALSSEGIVGFLRKNNVTPRIAR
jgi:S1-C subfamily serine protease